MKILLLVLLLASCGQFKGERGQVGNPGTNGVSGKCETPEIKIPEPREPASVSICVYSTDNGWETIEGLPRYLVKNYIGKTAMFGECQCEGLLCRDPSEDPSQNDYPNQN